MKAIDARTLHAGIGTAGSIDLVDAGLHVPGCDTLVASAPHGEQRVRALARFLLRRMDLTGTSAALISIPAPALLCDVQWMVTRAPARLRAVVPGNPWLDAATLAQMARHGVVALSIDGATLAAAGQAAAGALMRRLGAFGMHLQLCGTEAQRALPFVLGHAVPVLMDYCIGDGRDDSAAPEIEQKGHPDLWLRLRLLREASPLALERAGRRLRAHSVQRMVWGGGSAGPGAILSALPILIAEGTGLAGVLGANARWLAFGADLDWDEFGDAA
ncbi:hypothetical protein [Roseixanthobacter glucoisosaccharinicivorans]|uniref:hypothetical protein n=1 Tax=Roseixanthobacter glucoisosaccharinicivorans TaxID=3119923 RepID=UPI0037272644